MDNANKYVDIALNDTASYKEALNLKIYLSSQDLKTKEDSVKFANTLKTLNEKDPKNDMVFSQLAAVLQALGDKDGASKLIESRLALNPNDYSALALKAQNAMNAATQDPALYDVAIENFKKAIAIKPNDDALIYTYLAFSINAKAAACQNANEQKALCQESVTYLEKARDIRHAPAPRESFRLLYISKSRFGGDWNSTVHTHSCTELFYCLSGEGQFLLSGQLFPVKPDDMVIVNPQVEHTELSLNASPLEYIVLGVSGIEILFGKADSTYAIFNCRENRERMVTLLHMLLAEADRSLDGCETVCQDLLEVLLIWLVRCTTLSLQVEESPRSDNRECVEIKRYLDNNYREDISLDTLAEVAHINKYYLAHTFQKAYGISPITYLNRRRIEESKYMLGNTGYSLAQISELMGFSSPSYFSQCFRKAEGLTPNEYRRQVRQGQRPAPAKRHEG